MSEGGQHSVILLTGCNLGNKEQTLETAAEMIHKRVGRVVTRSQILYSEAWGFSANEQFANQALEVLTDLEPIALLDTTQAIEHELGRNRTEEQSIKQVSGQKYCSRTIDIDIIFYDQLIMHSTRLTLPHPLMHKREFVLRPITQIACKRLHPELQLTVEQMLDRLTTNAEG